MMSEETIQSAAPAASSGAEGTTTTSPATRKKAPTKAASTARRSRQRASAPTARSDFGVAALASSSRADSPSIDDPFQSGQRIWPD